MINPEKKCPKCKDPINWKVVHSDLGAPIYNGLCVRCNIVFKGRETPELAKGKELERSGATQNKTWKEIARYPCDVQIGILRERQNTKVHG